MHENKINHKKYIGITSQDPKYRFKNGLGYKRCPRFYSAIKSYGWDMFNHFILFTNLSKEEAEQKESELIAKYRTNIDGYNIENGGVIHKLSKEQKEHIRRVNLGKKHSQETIEKMRKSQIGKQKCLGYKHGEETRRKHAKLWTGEKNPRAKSIFQLDLNGTLINRFNTMQEAVKALGVKGSAHISDCCRGKRNKAYGFIWRYEVGDINGD